MQSNALCLLLLVYARTFSSPKEGTEYMRVRQISRGGLIVLMIFDRPVIIVPFPRFLLSFGIAFLKILLFLVPPHHLVLQLLRQRPPHLQRLGVDGGGSPSSSGGRAAFA